MDRRTPGRLAYELLAFPLGLAYFVFLVTGLAVGTGTAITLIGIPVLVGMLFAWRGLAMGERRLLNLLLGLELADPYRPLGSPSALGRLRERIADPATWKDLVYLFLAFPLGLFSFVVTVTTLSVALGLLLAPVYSWALPEAIDLGFLELDTTAEALLCVPFGLLAGFLALLAIRVLAAMHTSVASLLLGSSPDPELSARVQDLQGSRARIIAAADAERRRLERDLHDGAQQRLVAVSLVLGLARRRMASGEPAEDLVAQADEEARQAITELRDLARGIHPAILTDRGLEAGLRDLAARASVPVVVSGAPEERLPEPVEAAAYFLVSEALTNVAKYAQATEASVDVRVEGGAAVIEVADDGIGGAQPGSGSGLRGLADRVGALDGSLQLDSPPGQGTRLRARIPINGAVAAPRAFAQHAEVADDPDRAARRRRLHRRAFSIHAAVYAVVMALLCFIWLTTGAGYFWPQWPIAGWGAVLAIHGWVVRW
jgi:signal transduction histidine kinase